VKVEDFIGEKVTYDKFGQYLWGHKKDIVQKLADVRGWGAIQHLFDNEIDAQKFQDEFGQWLADTINEKLLTLSKTETVRG